MADFEQMPPTQATEESVPRTPSQEPAVATPSAAFVPDWRAALDSVDPEELVKHPRVAGILGSRIDQRIRQREADLQAEARRHAEAEQDDELTRLLDENDQTLAERYPKARERLQALRDQRAQEAIQRQIGESKAAFAGRIGRAYTSLPEWSEMTPTDMETLKTALAGKSDDDAVEAFAVAAAALVAEKRADRRVNERVAQEIEQARAATRQELQAEAMARGKAPDLRRPGGLPDQLSRIRSMSAKEFDDYWQKTYG